MLTTSAPSTFGDLLRHYRQAAGLTQQQLAERAGLSVHGIQKLERGATHPYRDTAQRLIAALQLEARDKSSFEAAVAPVRRHSATPAAEPPLARRHNLPLSTTRLIGRETAIDEVVGRLADTRLLTLTGVGGCGKTRLALEVGRSLIDDYRDGVWLVELGPVVDPALVAPRVAAVLGIRETAEQSLAGVLASALRDRQILLILDNCEHLLDACAHLIDGLLKACPDLKVLATSREPIGIDGEVAWRVPSLAVPEAASTETPQQLLLNAAVQLFIQRSTAAQPRFMLTARNASSVVQICRRLDGIPLALELAAARIDSLTAEQIARRLDQRFQLLTGGSRAVLPRQQTLSATLRWSYDLLGRAERRLFERLTVFSGGWSLEAAEAVCAGNGLNGDEILDLLAQLTRKSLVVADERADGGERYWMLETVRDYARQKLGERAAAEISALRDRHAAFYAVWIERQVPDPRERWSVATPGLTIDALSGVDAEFDNIRATLNWCVESDCPAPGIRLAVRLLFFWEARGLYSEARRGLGALLELADPSARDSRRMPLDRAGRADAITPAERAAATFIVGSCALRQGDYEEARGRYDGCIEVWRKLGDDQALAAVLAERGLVAWQLGDPDEAIDYLEASRRLFEQWDRGNPVSAAHAANALRNLGMVARSRGDYAHAAAYFRESVTLGRLFTAGGGYSVARGLCQLGRTVYLQGDVAQSKQLFDEALDVMRVERLAGHLLADCLDWLASVADADGRPRAAATSFGAADAQWQASGGVRYAPERPAYEVELTRVKGKLAPDEFAAAWAEGRAMSREEAVDFGLHQTRLASPLQQNVSGRSASTIASSSVKD